MNLKRFLRHLVTDRWIARGAFPDRTMTAIEASITHQETRHDGEIRFAVEAALPFGALLAGMTPRERAIELFSALRVWDTKQNAGILVYVLIADQGVEIVADRGIHARVGEAAWEAICGAMEREFAEGRFEAGAIVAVRAISDLLATHFPPQAENPDELPNRPVLL
jgi:uncharacterized membrane protein